MVKVTKPLSVQTEAFFMQFQHKFGTRISDKKSLVLFWVENP